MDAVLQSLGGSLPQLGVGGVVVFVISLLVKLLIDERGSQDAELTRKGERLLVELKRKDDELERLRERLAAAEAATDVERKARREAEDAAAAALRGRRRREEPTP